MPIYKKLFLTAALLMFTAISLFAVAPEESPHIKIFFSDKVNLNHKLAEHIDNAEESINACFYSLASEEVANSLLRSRIRGVRVQIVFDSGRLFEEDSFYPKLRNFGVAKKDEKTSGLMHHKFCVIDEKFVWTGSYNPSPHAIYTNNDALLIESEKLAEIYLREFRKLWNEQTLDAQKKLNNKVKIGRDFGVEVYFSPEEGNIILKRLLEVLSGAESSIYFAQFTMTHPDIASVLMEQAGKGIDVKGIMEYEQIGAYSQYQHLKEAGVNVRKDRNYCFSFHHKFFIIDEKIVITGSLNPSKAGLNKNRENILFIDSDEVAQKYMRYFENAR